MTKPFLKWVGGKTQILDDVFALFPTDIFNYHEPFLGGGSVLLRLLSDIQEGHRTLYGDIYASDVNPILIALYKHVQTDVEGLIKELKEIENSFKENESTQEVYYYTIRDEFNHLSDKTTVKAAALMLFLNKTCFRGVYREGPHGFNVPFGHYKNPTVTDADNLREVSQLIQPVIFTCQTFHQAFAKVEPEDFVYCDPPYAPETDTSFDSYVSGGFPKEYHDALFAFLKTKKVKFVMSNAHVPMVIQAFPSSEFKIQVINAKRAIHSKDPGKITQEVLITNE
jgi:DNA adenine methylase